MKRKYVIPQTEVYNIVSTGILMNSGLLDENPADENARARSFDGDDE